MNAVTCRRTSGFSMVEILIAMVVFGIVIAQAFAMFGAQRVTQERTSRSVEAQHDVRLVAEAVAEDVRMGGFLVPRVAGVSSRDGGAGAADVLCVSDADVFAQAEIDDAMDHVDRAQLSVALGASENQVQLAAGHLDIDEDGNADFTAGAGIIVAGPTNSHCAVIQNIAGNTITFTPATPAGFLVGATDGRASPAVVWELAGTDLRRNGLRLSTRVEDLQIEYGIDANGDGQLAGAEFPIHDLAGDDASEVRRVQISVIARTDGEDDAVESIGRPAAGNRTAGGADGFRRRRVTLHVLPRNLL